MNFHQINQGQGGQVPNKPQHSRILPSTHSVSPVPTPLGCQFLRTGKEAYCRPKNACMPTSTPLEVSMPTPAHGPPRASTRDVLCEPKHLIPSGLWRFSVLDACRHFSSNLTTGKYEGFLGLVRACLGFMSSGETYCRGMVNP